MLVSALCGARSTGDMDSDLKKLADERQEDPVVMHFTAVAHVIRCEKGHAMCQLFSMVKAMRTCAAFTVSHNLNKKHALQRSETNSARLMRNASILPLTSQPPIIGNDN
eukprot:1159171-Pelagomonas_calceolata.AAC.1